MASSNIFRRIRLIIYIIVSIGLVVVIGMRFFGKNKEPEYITTTVQRGTVAQTVILTGTVQPDMRYRLQFQKPGKIGTISVKIGDSVSRGDTLASLQNDDIYYQIEGQKAMLRFAQSNLAKALASPKEEETDLQKLKIILAENEAAALTNARYYIADTARRGFESPLLDLQKSIELGHQLEEIDANVEKARLQVMIAEKQLNLLNSKPRNSDIAPLQAQIEQAWQNVKLTEHQLEQSKIIAPVDGIITDIMFQEGENYAGQPVIILDTKSFYIKVLISEADMPKIRSGQNVYMTFDAFEQAGELIGSVRELHPAETVIQGVIYYMAKIDFDAGRIPVKAGMTVNLTVRVSEKNNVLLVPARAVEYEKNQAYVQIAVNKNGSRQEKIERRNIYIGLQSDENVEVVNGLNEGDEVVTSVKK